MKRNGEITITFNSKHEKLYSGPGMVWLVCSKCDHVQENPDDVTAFLCDVCLKKDRS